MGNVAKLLLRLGLLSGLLANLPLVAQQVGDYQDRGPAPTPLDFSLKTDQPTSFESLHDYRTYWMRGIAPGYSFARPRTEAAPFDKIAWSTSPGTIQRMEAAFYCNDTPFVDQVRFPLGTLWRGRVKFVGFESDVTTANFVLGLPGQGALHSLSAFGNAFIATHTPPSDQLAGIHMSFSWRTNAPEPGDSSGLHGMQYLVRAGRGFLPFLSARPDSISATAR